MRNDLRNGDEARRRVLQRTGPSPWIRSSRRDAEQRRFPISSNGIVACVFGGIFTVTLIVAYFVGGNLTRAQGRILALFSSIMAALLTFFMSGAIEITAEGQLAEGTKFVVRATTGLAVLVFVILWWQSDFSPAKLGAGGGPGGAAPPAPGGGGTPAAGGPPVPPAQNP